jgi:hypothetical protein
LTQIIDIASQVLLDGIVVVVIVVFVVVVVVVISVCLDGYFQSVPIIQNELNV